MADRLRHLGDVRLPAAQLPGEASDLARSPRATTEADLTCLLTLLGLDDCGVAIIGPIPAGAAVGIHARRIRGGPGRGQDLRRMGPLRSRCEPGERPWRSWPLSIRARGRGGARDNRAVDPGAAPWEGIGIVHLAVRGLRSTMARRVHGRSVSWRNTVRLNRIEARPWMSPRPPRTGRIIERRR